MKNFIDALGYISSIALPFFNIPLMLHIYRRKKSDDLSMTWLLGIFFCLAGMIPSGLQSPDPIFRLFSLLNFGFFAGVTYLALYYRWRKKN